MSQQTEHRFNPGHKRPPLLWIGIVVAVLSGWYVTVTAGDLFRGWGDWLILFLMMMAVIATGWYMQAPQRWAVPEKIDARRVVRIGSAVVGVSLVILAVVSWSLGALSWDADAKAQGKVGVDNFMEVLTLLSAAVAIGFLLFAKKWGMEESWNRRVAERKSHRAEAKLRRLQQAGLKQDFPPHLLFNSLSVVRVLTRRNPQQARQATALISELVRFYVRKCKLPQIPLHEELIQVERLKQLYALRTDKPIEIEIDISPAAHRTRIIPMLLVLLVENMMKHGVTTDPDRPARLVLKRVDNRTEIVAKNHVVEQSPEIPEGLGIALQHIRKQLHNLYPGRSSLHTSMEENVFTISLFFIN